ncbi:MAG: hypothetical protein DRP45_00895 [Candidatus Zixiibacteriota bacterium]|nr:MAG: hypothetical protein DRP45_00895 [candidate division Zixibacteria bacterium]
MADRKTILHLLIFFARQKCFVLLNKIFATVIPSKSDITWPACNGIDWLRILQEHTLLSILGLCGGDMVVGGVRALLGWCGQADKLM